MSIDHATWLAQVNEVALEPELAICDAHHHLWLDKGHTGWPYTLSDFHADTSPESPARHNVVRSVFLECGAEYRTTGPEHLRPVGETEFVAALAQESAGSGRTEIAAIMASADLLLGNAVEEVLVAHDEAGAGRFRGVRICSLLLRPARSAVSARSRCPGVAPGSPGSWGHRRARPCRRGHGTGAR